MNPSADSPETRIALFQRKQVRRTIHNNEWWFVMTDVIVALTDSTNPSDYLKKMRKRDPLLADAFKGGGQIVPPLALPFETEGGSDGPTGIAPREPSTPPDMRFSASGG
jgi:hypothetical protein